MGFLREVQRLNHTDIQILADLRDLLKAKERPKLLRRNLAYSSLSERDPMTDTNTFDIRLDTLPDEKQIGRSSLDRCHVTFLSA